MHSTGRNNPTGLMTALRCISSDADDGENHRFRPTPAAPPSTPNEEHHITDPFRTSHVLNDSASGSVDWNGGFYMRSSEAPPPDVISPATEARMSAKKKYGRVRRSVSQTFVTRWSELSQNLTSCLKALRLQQDSVAA
ncbi:hypothetical protein ACCO45_004510 [Purpureocillium lilacinum]|uniref:Uncharacterized protein n=1 Tax=Purpureocillium lilacinum TaxID=33203 RepID=A0ACC4E496_PURLI